MMCIRTDPTRVAGRHLAQHAHKVGRHRQVLMCEIATMHLFVETMALSAHGIAFGT
jgi:hypothetical protein